MKTYHNKIFITALLVFLFTGMSAFAQKKTHRKSKGKWKMSFRLLSTYDDNALKYSEKYLDRFMNNQDPGRFKMVMYDDVSWKGRLFVSYRKKWIPKHYTKVSAAVQRTQYSVNSFKSWNMFSVYVQQDFAKKGALLFTYQYLPYFYVRTYRDEDLVSIYGYAPNTFRPFEFAKEHYGFSVRNTFYKKWRLQTNLGLHRYFHNSHFTEYDAGKYYAGVKVAYPLTNRIKLNAGYQYAYNDAKGIDEEGEDKLTSDDPDATFMENKFDLKAGFSPLIRSKRKQSIDFQTSFAERDYTSAKAYRDDPTHVGRTDHIYSFTLTYGIQWTGKIKTSIVLNRNFRYSTSAGSAYYRELLADDKNYTQNLLGIQFNYKIF